MRCPNCGSDVTKSTTACVTDLGDVLVVVRNVPCFKCNHCDEIIYAGDVLQNLERFVNIAKSLKQEISVIDYSKNVA